MAVFYDTVRRPGQRTITGDYASAVVRRFFDVRSPLAQWVSVPRSYVILQRINLGLFADPGRAHGHGGLARHRRGDLAVHPGTAVDADGGGRGGVAGRTVPGGRAGRLMAHACDQAVPLRETASRSAVTPAFLSKLSGRCACGG